MVNVKMPSVAFSYNYAERHYAECRYAECCYAESPHAGCHYAECPIDIKRFMDIINFAL